MLAGIPFYTSSRTKPKARVRDLLVYCTPFLARGFLASGGMTDKRGTHPPLKSCRKERRAFLHKGTAFPLGGEPRVMRITTVWCARTAN